MPAQRKAVDALATTACRVLNEFPTSHEQPFFLLLAYLEQGGRLGNVSRLLALSLNLLFFLRCSGASQEFRNVDLHTSESD